MSHTAEPSIADLAAVLGEVKGLAHPELAVVLAKALHPSWSLAAAEKVRTPKHRPSRAKRQPEEKGPGHDLPPDEEQTIDVWRVWAKANLGPHEPEPDAIAEKGRPHDYACDTAVERLAWAYEALTDKTPTISRHRIPKDDQPGIDRYPSGGAFLNLMRAVQAVYGIDDDWTTRAIRVSKAYAEHVRENPDKIRRP